MNRLLTALLSAACLLALPGVANAKTTTVATHKDLSKLARKTSLSGSWVIAVPGVRAVSLPRLERVEGRLDFATPGLLSVDLPALEEVGSDLFVGCDLPAKQDWERLGPIRPLEQVHDTSRSEFGVLSERPGRTSAAAEPQDAQPGSLSLPALTRVGGGFAVCSPGLLSIDAPLLAELGTDLQLFAGPSWDHVALGAVRRVRARVFVWLAGPDLELDLSGLVTVDGSTQLGGLGTLRVDLSGLVTTAALVITGSRRTSSGQPAPRPSLELPDLALPALQRVSNMIELRTIGGLTDVAMPSLEHTGRLGLGDLPSVTTVHAPKLADVGGDVALTLLPALTGLELPGLVSIGGDLSVAGLATPSLELPPVETIGGALVLSGLRRIRVARAGALRSAGAIRVSGVGAIDLLEFPALEELGGPFVVDANIATTADSPLPALAVGDDAVRVLSAPNLRTVGGDDEHGLRIAGSAFSSVRLDALERIGGPLVLVDLPALSGLSLPHLSEIGGTAVVGEAPALSTLGLPRLVRVDSLELRAMDGLKRLSAPRLTATLRQSGGTHVERVEMADP